MSKEQRQKVFEMFGGKCAYCGCDLGKRWHVDHVQAMHRDSRYDKEKGKFVATGTCQHPENDREDNYMPACASCNISKSTMTVEKFKAWIQDSVRRLNTHNYNSYKFGKRYGLIQETGIEVKFYFETVNADQP